VATKGSKSLLNRKVATKGSKSLDIPQIIGVAFLGECITAGRRVALFFKKQLEAHNSPFLSDLSPLVATFDKKSDFEPIAAMGRCGVDAQESAAAGRRAPLYTQGALRFNPERPSLYAQAVPLAAGLIAFSLRLRPRVG
jgi:hypothetical protein